MRALRRGNVLVLAVAMLALAGCFGSAGGSEEPADEPGDEEMVFTDEEAAEEVEPDESEPQEAPPDDAPEPPPPPDDGGQPADGENTIDLGDIDMTAPPSGLWSLTIDPGTVCDEPVPGVPAQRVVVTVSDDGQSMEWVSLDYADALTPLVERAEDTGGGFAQYKGSYSEGDVTENWTIVYLGAPLMQGTLETFADGCPGKFDFYMEYTGPYEE